MELKKAQRQQIKLRVGFSGPSGFGKTYSALLMAYGMTNDWTKIAVIDTENGSADLYSDLGDYNTLTLSAPFSPERYIEAIRACEKAGMEVIIIDSISHEWEGRGGCLEIADQVTQASASKNSYTAWAKVTPRHQSFIDAILQCKCHVFTTVRRKQDYDMVKEGNKTQIVKLGMKEVTREGYEYELTLNFEFISDRHYVKASKDRTGLFMDKPEFIITSNTGKELSDWCMSGEPVKDQLQDAIDEMKGCKTKEDAAKCWTKWHSYQANPDFLKEKESTKVRLTPNQPPANTPDDKILTQAMAELMDGKTTADYTGTWNKYPFLQSHELFSKEFNRRLNKLKQTA